MELKNKKEKILDLSIKSQTDNDPKAKVAYLIEMLSELVKGTRYQMDVMDAISDYYNTE